MKISTKLFICLIFVSQTIFPQWQISYGPFGLNFIRVQCFNQIGTNLFAGTLGDGVWISTDNSMSEWTKVSSGLTGKNVRALLVVGTNLFAATDSGAFLTTNNGNDWTGINDGLTSTIVTSFALIDTNLFATTFGGGVFLSTNNGLSWAAVNNDLPSLFISSLAVIGTNLFAGNSGFQGGIYLTSNYGASWTHISIGQTGDPVSSIYSNGSNLFAVTVNSGVFLSTNNGESWNLVNGGLPNAIEVHFASSGQNIFAGAYSSGVYLSTDNGNNWIEANEGFGSSRTIRTLAILGEDLFAGFYDGSVRRRSLSEMITSVEENNNEIPIALSLAQNYPNPFNPSTTIYYTIPKQSNVTLKVFDALGSEVAILNNKEHPQGNYEVEFDGSDLTSGVYFFRLQAGEFIETKKMILIK